MFERIVSYENILAAWRKFKKGKMNKSDVLQYAWDVEHRLYELRERLAMGAWKHGGYKRFTVCDPKPRTIHKACVEDRIVHHTLARVIEPICERSFIYDSWSCRKGKGTHAAVRRAHEQLIRLHKTKENVWVLRSDIVKCFASINHRILMQVLSRRIRDEEVLDMCHAIIKSFPDGLPLGNLTSQLFVNVYLNELDHFVKETLRIPTYLRYSDDILIANANRNEIEHAREMIGIFLKERLRLKLHEAKTCLRPFHQGVDWLGYMLYPHRRRMRTSSKKRMLRRVERVAQEYINNHEVEDRFKSVLSAYHGHSSLESSDRIRKHLSSLRYYL